MTLTVLLKSCNIWVMHHRLIREESYKLYIAFLDLLPKVLWVQIEIAPLFTFVNSSNHYQTHLLTSSFHHFRSQTSRFCASSWLYRSLCYVSIIENLFVSVRLFDWLFRQLFGCLNFVNNFVNFTAFSSPIMILAVAVSRDFTD